MMQIQNFKNPLHNIFSIGMTSNGDYTGEKPNNTIYHIFIFENEPVAIWKLSNGEKPVEFLKGIGWYNKSDYYDYQSDIINSIHAIAECYNDLPKWVREILGDAI